MPIGVIINALSVFLGGLLGCAVRKLLSDRIKQALTGVFCLSAISMGVTLIIRVNTLSVMVLSLILGTLFGAAVRLEERVNRCIVAAAARLVPGASSDVEELHTICTLIVMFCFSGTGIFGALNEGFTGDSSILIAKSILDFFTAVIFAAVIGRMVAFIAAPQVVFFLLLFFCSNLLMPLINDQMLGNFSAVGGVITLAAGLRIGGIKKDLSVLDMVPGLVLCFPLTLLLG